MSMSNYRLWTTDSNIFQFIPSWSLEAQAEVTETSLPVPRPVPVKWYYSFYYVVLQYHPADTPVPPSWY